MTTRYMHTLDHQPAYMDDDGTQIVFAGGRNKARLCNSLRQIRQEQKASDAWRKTHGLPVGDVRAGYILVENPK